MYKKSSIAELSSDCCISVVCLISDINYSAKHIIASRDVMYASLKFNCTNNWTPCMHDIASKPMIAIIARMDAISSITTKSRCFYKRLFH